MMYWYELLTAVKCILPCPFWRVAYTIFSSLPKDVLCNIIIIIFIITIIIIIIIIISIIIIIVVIIIIII